VKCCQVLFVLQVLSKVSVDEVFMHYFETIESASGGFAPALAGGLRSVLQTPSVPTPGNNMLSYRREIALQAALVLANNG